MARIYHEKQDAALCGVHALNNLLQGRHFSEVDLMQIAQELDAKEKSMMMEMGTETSDFLKYMAEDSGNVGEDGNFSIEVLKGALEVWNLEVVPLTHPNAKETANAPEKGQAFLCNLMSHWFAIRVINGTFWNLNSLLDAPQKLSHLYLGAYLKQLSVEGYTIFEVQGRLPPADVDYSDPNWTTVRENAGNSNSRARGGGYDEDEELKRAIALSLQDNSSQSNQSQNNDVMVLDDDEDEDADLKAAIALSLQSNNNSQSTTAPVPNEERPAVSLSDQPPTKRQRTAPPEPAPGTLDSFALNVRLSDGRKVSRRFQSSNTVGDVMAWLEAESSANLSKMALLMSFPRQKLLEDSVTLASVGINGPTALTLTDRD